MFTTTQTTKVMKLSRPWVIKMLNEGVLKGHKDNEGHWMVDEESVKKYMEVQAKKEEERISNIENSTFIYKRPRVMVMDMMVKVVNDGREKYNLSQDEITTLTTILSKVKKVWDKEYEERGS
jgi:hypothetical protein